MLERKLHTTLIIPITPPQFNLLFKLFKYSAGTQIFWFLFYVLWQKTMIFLKITNATNTIREKTRGVKVGRGEVKLGASKKGCHDLYLKKNSTTELLQIITEFKRELI